MGVALAAMCLMSAQAQRRNEIQVPNLNGYTTLKCDFHMHSVFSDGLVWPTVRVDEATEDATETLSSHDLFRIALDAESARSL